MFKNFKKLKYNKGVTLVELLVVIFIFVIISGITIFNYGRFNTSLSIQNLADDIALSVRKAQGYAIGVHSAGTGGVFTIGYGIHFTVNPAIVGNIYSGTNKSFIVFSDMGVTQNKMYDYSAATCGSPSVGNECLEALNITSTDKISGIKYYTTSLIDGSTGFPGATMDIVFKRPNPEPVFCYKTAIGNPSCDFSSTISYAQIILLSGDGSGTTKTITISNSGQISVSS